MSDELFDHIADPHIENTELVVEIAGDYQSGPLINTGPTTVTFVPGYTRWQRLCAFIRRRKLTAVIEIPNAQVSSLRYDDDGTASVKITALEALRQASDDEFENQATP